MGSTPSTAQKNHQFNQSQTQIVQYQPNKAQGQSNKNLQHYQTQQFQMSTQQQKLLEQLPKAVFQVPQVPQIPMNSQKFGVIKNEQSIQISTVKLVRIQDQEYRLEFTYDTLTPISLQVYTCVTEQIQPITGLTLKCLNFLNEEKQEINKETKNQQYSSHFTLDFGKLQPVQLKYTREFWPLIIRLENFKAEKSVIYYYFDFHQKNNHLFQPKLRKQKMERNFNVFLIDEIYGVSETGLVHEENKEENLNNAAMNRFSDQDKECIICLEEKIDTIIMPCRHMCIGIQCAKLFQQQKSQPTKNRKANTNQCPVCRADIELFLRIKQEHFEEH